MTNEEAINVLRAMKDECILVFDKDRKDALDKAISALDKQCASNEQVLPSCGDLISRQDAIDALDNIKIPGNASWYPYYQQALTAMSRLPSAQPEQR